MTLFLVLETQPHAQPGYRGLFATAKQAQGYIDKQLVEDEDASAYLYIESVKPGGL